MSSQTNDLSESGSNDTELSSEGDMTISGNVAGRDIITTNIGLSVQELVKALQQALPKDDPRPSRIGKTLADFQSYHTELHEWKELHNALNEIINAFDPFAAQVARSQVTRELLKPRIYRDSWRPTNRCVINLLRWATTIQKIGTAYQAPLPHQPEAGETWARDIRAGTDTIMNHIENGLGIEANQANLYSRLLEVGPRRQWELQLYEHTREFDDIVKRHMSHTDKQLRDTATKLYQLSQHVFGGKP